MEMLQKMGEMLMIGVNGACVVVGFSITILVTIAVIGFIGNIIGILLGGDKHEEG